MSNSKPTQAQCVLDYMMRFGSITTRDAFDDLGITRLSARVFELRKGGHNITGERVKVKNRFGEDCIVMEYRINDLEKEA